MFWGDARARNLFFGQLEHVGYPLTLDPSKIGPNARVGKDCAHDMF
jgi:hypothetical protein